MFLLLNPVLSDTMFLLFLRMKICREKQMLSRTAYYRWRYTFTFIYLNIIHIRTDMYASA